MKIRSLILSIIWVGLLFPLASGGPGQAQDFQSSPIYRELVQAGFEIVETGVRYGVPYVEIVIPEGMSISYLCREIPTLKRDFLIARKKIAFFNSLNPFYIKSEDPEPYSIETDTLKIPLDLSREPEIFPKVDESLAHYGQYILVDIGKGYLALYEEGELKRVFPVSAGRGRRTPLFAFRVQKKIESHYSTKYDAWMPWALMLRRPYYAHGGVLPGTDDSAGCIRLFVEDARELFHLVEVGTPGRIVRSRPEEAGAPAPTAQGDKSFPTQARRGFPAASPRPEWR